MIKAKKGLLITLFAAMMIFAFGATSAFAATPTETWADDYSKVTLSGYEGEQAVWNGDYAVTRTFDKTTGQVTATPVIPSITPAPTIAAKTYYDLSGAVFAHADGKAVSSTYAAPTYWSAVNGLMFGAPSYVTNNTETGKKYVALSTLNAIGNWQGAIKGIPEDFSTTATTDQDFSLSLDVTFTTDPTVTPIIGKIADMAVSVKGVAAGDPTKALFFMDKVPESPTTTDTTVNYDGAEHVVVMNEVKGYTVKYTVFNKSTGKWDDASAVTVKDAGTVNAKAQLYDAKGEKATGGEYTLTVTVKPVNAASFLRFGFATTNDAATKAEYSVDGEEYDAASYVVAGTLTTATDAQKAAIAANEADLIALCKEAYDVTATPSKDNANKVFLTIAAKKDADAAALVKKYEALCSNLGITTGNVLTLAAKPATVGTQPTATITLNAALIDYEVEFTDTPTAMTYKAKKLKKKAASFTVTAVANNNATVKYKLIDAPQKITIDKATGKITLAKGLKKGTYKVKVKAYVPGYSDYAFETQMIKIKVKK